MASRDSAWAATVIKAPHTAIDCRWGEPTAFVLHDPYETWQHPWSCVRGDEPRLIRTFDDCLSCVRWEPRVVTETPTKA